MIKRETSTSVAELHTVSERIKRLAISIDGKPVESNSRSAIISHIDTVDNSNNSNSNRNNSSSSSSSSNSNSDRNSNSRTHQANHTPPTTNAENMNFAQNPFSLTVPDEPRLVTVMSHAKDNFADRYDILNEIGKGGFSTVYRCRERFTGSEYAVKVVDLRPLRLKEKYNPVRIRREVDIIRRLKHENIVQFVDVYETEDQLLVVMEYCPGVELFDVILAHKNLNEEIAKVIFVQIAKALFYLHSMNILHRDIKPENVLILNEPHPITRAPVAKLLDFGLSKQAGNGSVAKTFVGTPCYVAPEVEYTSRGIGGSYGLPADCWSAGAVLYVMLVARFPEFEQDPTSGKVVVRMSPALWDGISSDAKDLIRGLMNTNPAARLTMANALQHRWLGQYALTKEQLSQLSLQTYELGRNLHEEVIALSASSGVHSISAADAIIDLDMNTPESEIGIRASAMVVANGNNTNSTNSEQQQQQQQQQQQITSTDVVTENFPVGPLLHLQRQIASCFDETYSSYQHMPEIAAKVRRGAMLCRTQLTESTKMLRTVEQTAVAVLDIFPDLELAVQEGEPQLAAELFGMIRQWVGQLRETVATTQAVNKESIEQIQSIIESSVRDLQNQPKRANPNSITVPIRLIEAIYQGFNGNTTNNSNTSTSTTVCNALKDIPHNEDEDVEQQRSSDESITMSSEQVLELFMALFGTKKASISPAITIGTVVAERGGATVTSNTSFDSVNSKVRELTPLSSGDSVLSSPMQEQNRQLSTESRGDSIDIDETVRVFDDGNNSNRPSLRSPPSTPLSSIASPDTAMDSSRAATAALPAEDEMQVEQQSTHLVPSNPTAAAVATSGVMLSDVALAPTANSPVAAASKLSDALSKLRQVDEILEHLSVFWANTEVVLEVLTKKGQHVEHFIGFASKPKLMARFLERLEEYKRFWEGVSFMCQSYLSGVAHQPTQYNDNDNNNNNNATSTTSTATANTPATAAQTPSSTASTSSKAWYSFLDCEEFATNMSDMRMLSSKSSISSQSGRSAKA